MSKKAKKVVAQVSPVEALVAKLELIKELRTKIAGLKVLFAQHDALVEEILPLFIDKSPERFVINRTVKLGSHTYTFTPHFYDSKKDRVLAKVWKSCAYETGTIA